ncbi:hypothetical protein ACN9ML_14050 [Dyadobacter endophyticus]|uniref:hypothetical protein n=1 Tax=Dyadobacter endophyticus TaxID=1749036 RepID=UPI003CEDA738
MKLLYTAVFLLTIQDAFSQVEKGHNIYSGNMSVDYWNFSQPGSKTSTWNPRLGMEVHHFTKPGLAIGVEFNLRYFSQSMNFVENGASRPGRGHELSVIPQIRKYWKVSPFYVYAGAGLNLSQSSQKVYFEDESIRYSDYKFKAFSIVPQARLGILYPVNKRLSIEAAALSNVYPASFERLQLGLVIASNGDNVAQLKSADGVLSPHRWILSGTFKHSYNETRSYDQEVSEYYENSGTLVRVGTGVFISNRVLIGTDLTVGFRDNAINDQVSVGVMGNGSKKPWSFGIRPYLRKYLSDMRLVPYWEVGTSYSRIMAGVGATNTYSVDGSFGLAYVFGRRWLLHAKLVGMTVGYSSFPNNKSEIATLLGGEKISALFYASLKPSITLVYCLK